MPHGVAPTIRRFANFSWRAADGADFLFEKKPRTTLTTNWTGPIGFVRTVREVWLNLEFR